MASQVITRPGPTDAPLDLELGALDELTPQSAFAHFDGSGAAGAFLPALTYYTQDGAVFARALGLPVAAGESADVSFFPGLSAPGTEQAATGGGIQFDTENSGDWLSVETTSFDPTDPFNGIRLESKGLAGEMLIATEIQTLRITGGGDLTHGGVEILCNGNHLSIIMDSPSASPLVIDTMQRQELDIASSNSQSGNVNICGDPGTVGNSLSFFESGGVGQQPTPVTLADVIAVLQAFGLVA